MEDLYTEINDYLRSFGPTEAMELAKKFDGQWSITEVLSAVDDLIDEGGVYFDDDGILFLIPLHQEKLIDSGTF